MPALLAFVFETVDSAAGMGFGTALAPLLFVLGFAPLEVVPAFLAAEAVTGLVRRLESRTSPSRSRKQSSRPTSRSWSFSWAP